MESHLTVDTFQKASYESLREDLNCEMVAKIQDVRQWGRELRSIKKDKCCHIVEVTIQEGVDEAHCDVLDLQMFFLNVSRIRKYPEMDRHYFVLAVQTESPKDYHRVKSYLYAQAQRSPNIRIFLQDLSDKRGWEPYGGEKSISAPDSFGRLVPLVSVSMRELVEDESVFLGNLSSEGERLSGDELREVMDDSHKHKRKRPPKPSRVVPQFEVLKICRYHLLYTLFQKIEGTKENKIEDKDWELRGELCNYLAECSQGLTFLDQFFWLYLLRRICERKELFSFSTVKQRYILRKDILIKTLNDATSYAEGVYQLLENSCQHTEHKIAYLGLRIYDTDITASNLGLEENMTTRLRLSRRYKQKSGSERTLIFTPAPEVADYLEIRILDDAFWQGDFKRPRGMLEIFHQNTQSEQESEARTVCTLKDLFQYISNRPDSIASHYGLRLFQKLVQVHDGCFLVSTPDAEMDEPVEFRRYFLKGQQYRESTGEWESNQGGQGGQRSTEYSILMPVSYEREDGETLRKSKGEIFELSYFKEQAQYLCVAMQFGFDKSKGYIVEKKEKLAAHSGQGQQAPQSSFTAREKSEQVRKIGAALGECIPQNGYPVAVVDVRGQSRGAIELFAKGLFLYLATRLGKSKRPLFALLFSNYATMQEFIRIFSVFYDSDGKQEYMGAAQIALCGFEEESGLPVVRCLLQGTRISTAYRSAVIFSYYDPLQSIGLLPQLRYLTYPNMGEKGGAPAQFPFDLYLKPTIFEGSWATKEVAETFDCWFVRWMKSVMERERGENAMGCKITGAHVRLASKVHISDFYEAETLFHNSGIIYRIACMLSAQILPELEKLSRERKNLAIIGYEAYSSLVVKEVVRILKLQQCTNSQTKVYDGVYFQEKGGRPVVHFSCPDDPGEKLGARAEYIFVYPIGTTLTTLYRVADTLLAQQKMQRFQYDCIQASYVIALVADWRENEKEHIYEQYWHLGENGCVSLLPNASSQSPESFLAHYVMMLYSEWHQAGQHIDTCMDHAQRHEMCVSYVDETSTLPAYIFPLKGRGIGGNRLLFNAEMGDAALGALKGCVDYGHIHAGQNHYRYYIHFDKYFLNIREDLEKQLDKNKVPVQEDAFNLVISPLTEQEAPFLKLLLDKLFHSYAHLIHIPIQAVFKEELRTQYAYITESYRRLHNLEPKVPFRIYYVSNSVTTGNTMQRARKLLSMLLKDESTDENIALMFDGVFTLINRCSIDTINAFVRYPQRDFFAYLHLDIPHFNLVDQRCPLCALSSRYQVMADEAVTNTLVEEFHELAQKFKAVSPERHMLWQQEQVLYAPSYFAWLCQWVYYRCKEQEMRGTKDDREGIKEFSNSLQFQIKRKLSALKDEGTRMAQDMEMQVLEKLSISKFSGDIQRTAVGLFTKYLLPEKNDRRLRAAHMAHYLFDSEGACEPKTGAVAMEEYQAQKIEKAREIIEESIWNIIKKETSGEQRVEWLLTCLKSFSREHIANFYFVRQAVFSIMQDLLELLLSGRKVPKMWAAETTEQRGGQLIQGLLQSGGEQPIKSLCGDSPALEYRICMMLMECLADMQSVYVLRSNTIEKVCAWYDALKEEQERAEARLGEAYGLLNLLPSKERLMFDYNKYMKWSTMVGDEDQRYFVLQDMLIKHINQRESTDG